MWESRYTDDEWEALAKAFRDAAGASSCPDFIPAEFYIITADDPRWEDPSYTKKSHGIGAGEGGDELGAR